jgi:hypothetical protein
MIAVMTCFDALLEGSSMIGNEIVSGQPGIVRGLNRERIFDVVIVSRIATPCTSCTVILSHPFLVMTESFLGNHDLKSS